MYYSKKQRTEISYLLIGPDLEEDVLFIPPQEFWNDCIYFTSKCPFDIIQLNSELAYTEIKRSELFYTPKDFKFCYSKDSLEILKELNPNQVSLIYLDCTDPFFDKIIKWKNENSRPIWFWKLLNDTTISTENQVHTPASFIEKIIKKKEEIKSLLELEFDIQKPEIETKELPIPVTTNLSSLNLTILKDIFKQYGNSGLEEMDWSDKENINKKLDEINVNPDHFSRMDECLDLIKINDGYTLELFKEKIVPKIGPSDAIFMPLILIAPYQNPDIIKLFRKSIGEGTEVSKGFVQVLATEQTNNYTFSVCTDAGFDDVSMGTYFSFLKIKYLDDVAYLHSSFTNSPILRLPLKGKSLNRELSFLKPQNYNHQFNSKNWVNLIHIISDIGGILRTNLISEKCEEVLAERNRQVCIISDLPLDWMLIRSVPFSFTHDLCRIPETGQAGIMSHFMSNSIMSFDINENIIKKTLVICGNNEPSFTAWNSVAKDLSNDLGFKFQVCLTLEEVKIAFDEFEPEFVIFDSHGGVDEATKQTYLCIGDEKLYGESVIKLNIKAPLIFISACGTAPSYGLYNSVANAFFENGTLAITATFLPISISSGTVLYIRVLNNLGYASKKGVHANWLSFVSHVVRTSMIYDYHETIKTSKREVISADLIRAMQFSERENLYNEMKDELVKSSKAPEYLFYTNLGRSDLIYFKSWKEKRISTEQE